MKTQCQQIIEPDFMYLYCKTHRNTESETDFILRQNFRNFTMPKGSKRCMKKIPVQTVSQQTSESQS